MRALQPRWSLLQLPTAHQNALVPAHLSSVIAIGLSLPWKKWMRGAVEGPQAPASSAGTSTACCGHEGLLAYALAYAWLPGRSTDGLYRHCM